MNTRLSERTTWLCLSLALAGGVGAACDASETRGKAPPPGERWMELNPDPVVESPARTLEAIRASRREVRSDARPCWTSKLGESITIGEADWSTRSRAVAVVVDPKRTADWDPQARIVFEVWRGGRLADGPSFRRELALGEAQRTWTRLELAELSSAGRGDWTLRARLAEDSKPTRAHTASEKGEPACIGWARASAAAAPSSAPNLFFIGVDTLRADHLGAYGYARATSPAIDRLAARGVVFEQALSASPWTLPSFATLFTGLWPLEHQAGIVVEREARFGVQEPFTPHHVEPCRADVPTLAEQLRDAGWSTGALVSNPYLTRGRGLARGFEHYRRYEYNAAVGVDLAMEWIAERERPWFLFLHLMDPHLPYAPPAPFDELFLDRPSETLARHYPTLASLRCEEPSAETKRELIALYDGEIAFTDAQLGRLFEFLDQRGLTQDTLIVLVSDHGEEFWEHGGFEHGHALHQEILRVPLILSWPERWTQERRVSARFHTVDLLPTLLELLGLAVPAGLSGRGALAVLDGAPLEARLGLAECLLWGDYEEKAVFERERKLIVGGFEHLRLFDLTRDPLEALDLEPAEPELAERLRRYLFERQAQAVGVAQPATTENAASSAERSELRTLGYAGD